MSVVSALSGSPGAALTPILVGLAVVRALSRIAPELQPGLKWPNDVLVRERKVCGILCEAAGTGTGIVAGIGVNVRQRRTDFPPELADRAISLEVATDRSISRAGLAGAVLLGLGDLLDLSELGGVADELAGVDVLRDRAVQIDPGPRGIARGIARDGALRVEDDRGLVHEVRSGHVTLVSEASAEELEGQKNGA